MGRILTGLLGIALAAASVAAAGWLPLPTVTMTPPSATVTPAPVAQQRLCPGPILHLGGTSGQDTSTLSSSGQADVSYSSSSGTVVRGTVASTDNISHTLPVVLTLPAENGDARLAGSQSQLSTAGDLVGFAAAACLEPGSETWLVGGATTTGRTTLITLSNISKVSATVDLGIYSEKGRIIAPGSTGIVVPASSQRVLPLAGFAPGMQSLVIHVLSHGGQVVANLQQSIVRTLDPGGVDIVAPTSAPSSTTVIPGIVLSNTAARLARASAPGYQDLQTVLRLFVPEPVSPPSSDGSTQAKTTVSIAPEGSPAAGTSFSLTAAAGRVMDVPIDIPTDGNYTVTVTADRPLVAGVRVSTVGSSGATDFAWLAAASPLTGPSQLSVAVGPSPELHLVNSATAPVTVQLTSAAGSSAVPIPAGSSTVVPVTPGSYRLAGFSSLRAAVSYSGDGTISGFTLYPPQPAAKPITVYP